MWYLRTWFISGITYNTIDDDCKSTFREATYATSTVSVCKNEVLSWDQGWNIEKEQVWGAETGGYIFKRIKNK